MHLKQGGRSFLRKRIDVRIFHQSHIRSRPYKTNLNFMTLFSLISLRDADSINIMTYKSRYFCLETFNSR